MESSDQGNRILRSMQKSRQTNQELTDNIMPRVYALEANIISLKNKIEILAKGHAELKEAIEKQPNEN